MSTRLLVDMNDFRKLVARAVEIKGSQKKLAEAIGCSQQQISYLLHGADRISVEMAVGIERATESEIKRSDLRPDIFGSEVAA